MKYTICYDTICDGYQPVIENAGEDNPNGTPVTFNSQEEAQEEINSDKQFYKDCFVCQISEIGHKAIYRLIPE